MEDPRGAAEQNSLVRPQTGRDPERRSLGQTTGRLCSPDQVCVHGVGVTQGDREVRHGTQKRKGPQSLIAGEEHS